MQNSAHAGDDVVSYGGNTASTSCDSVNIGTKKNPVYTYYSIGLSGSASIGRECDRDEREHRSSRWNDHGQRVRFRLHLEYLGVERSVGRRLPTTARCHHRRCQHRTTFPALSLPTSGWNIVSIPTSQCATYFMSIANEASGTTVANLICFQSNLENQTTRTVYEAPTCAVTYSNAQVFAMNSGPSSTSEYHVQQLKHLLRGVGYGLLQMLVGHYSGSELHHSCRSHPAGPARVTNLQAPRPSVPRS